MAKYASRKKPPTPPPSSDSDSPLFENFLGLDLTSVEVLARGVARLNAASGRMVQFAASLTDSRGPSLPPSPRTAIIRGAANLRTEAGVLRKAGLAGLVEARKAFRADLSLVKESAKNLDRSRKSFDASYKLASQTILTYHKSALISIKQKQFWGLRNLTAVIAPLVSIVFPRIELVFRHDQRHNIGGVVLPVTKVKLNFVLFGQRFNFALVQFRPPGVADEDLPPAKGLGPSGRVEAGGRTITALDSPGVEFGNPVLPAAGGTPEVRFNGYLKIIYVTGVPKGCRIRFQTIATGRGYILAGGAWEDLFNGDSGRPVADPPGGGPNHDLGGGMWGFSDFPNSSIPPGSPVCTYLIRDELFRTWVVEFCPEARPRILGYWEWSYRQILHMTDAGVVSVTQPPAPEGVPPPPGGWPTAPGSGPTQWVDNANAGDDPRGDHRRLYPESYPP